ncbi:MAG: LssY C-terminal domain-containing protein [Deltaproteobacteria bacterium]|nr:LssY C-terminal domain-containing protein [Deltaproteobacteria bacterium]
MKSEKVNGYMLGRSNMALLAVLMICSLAVVGCATFKPRPMEQVPFRERAQTKYENNARVMAAVPSAKESKMLFGVHIYKRGVQPIWLEIENRDEDLLYFLPIGLDPNYFSPIEAAFVNHFGFKTPANDEMNRYFLDRGHGIRIAPGSVRSGFVYTPVDEGTKEFNVDLIGEDHDVRTFTFFIQVPGLRADHHQVDFEALCPRDRIVSYDEEGLRKALENQPCCATNKNGTAQADPLNLVVIGEAEDVLYAFIRPGWDETETIHAGSAWRTGMSFIFGGRYRYSPISSLYVYGRSQDVAFQKARGSIHERNHLRLWLSPMRLEEKPVWIGQISRDIGVRFSWKTILTHKIDPDVDETRDFLIQDLWYSQGLAKIGYVKGVGPSPVSEPRHNLTGDPYFTDGLRAVLWVSSDPVGLQEAEFVEWEIPPDH